MIAMLDSYKVEYKEVSLYEILSIETADDRVRMYMPYRDEAAVQRHYLRLKALEDLPIYYLLQDL